MCNRDKKLASLSSTGAVNGSLAQATQTATPKPHIHAFPVIDVTARQRAYNLSFDEVLAADTTLRLLGAGPRGYAAVAVDELSVAGMVHHR